MEEVSLRIKQILHQKGVEDAYDYTDEDISRELLSLMEQVAQNMKRKSSDLSDQQLYTIAQGQIENVFGIVYEKLYEYYLSDIENIL